MESSLNWQSAPASPYSNRHTDRTGNFAGVQWTREGSTTGANLKTKAMIVLFAGLAIACITCAQRRISRDSAASKNRVPAPRSFKNGAWLFSNPSSPIGFDNSIFDAYRKQIELTSSILDQISRNPLLDGKRVNSDGLKPVGFYDMAVRVSDGENMGWMGKWSYLWYMNFHSVRSNGMTGTHSRSRAWLCPEGANAGRLSYDMDDVRGIGIQITNSVIRPLAKRNQCAQVSSDDLSMIDFANGFAKAKPSDYLAKEWEAVKVSDGKNTGWMPESLYLTYMERHVVRAR